MQPITPTTTAPAPRKSLDDIFKQTAPKRSLDDIFKTTVAKPQVTTSSAWDDASKNSVKDSNSANQNSALFPAETGESPLKAGLKSLGNVPSSTFNLGKNVVQAIAHPIKTVQGVGDTLEGGIRTGIEKVTGKELPSNEQTDQAESTFHTVAQGLKDRYGSVENAQRTATNDPVGFGADVLSLITGGASLAGKIPGVAKLAEGAAEAVKPLTSIPSAVNDTARSTVAGGLEKSAQRSLEKVLAPTKEADKLTTQKILPELAQRSKIAMSRKGLSNQVADELEQSGQAIDEAWKNLPAGSTEKVKPVVDALESSKSKFMVDGVVVEPDAWKAADNLQKTILEVAKDSPEVSSESLRRVRQIWDESIARNKGFSKELSDQDKISVKKDATNAIRKVLADNHPDIAKLNAEYSFWSKVDDVLGNTLKRKTGQATMQLGDKALGAGAVGGGTASAGVKGAIIGAGTVAAITLATKSTLWRTLSAAAKMKLARAIVERNPVDIKRILIPIVGEQGLGQIQQIESDDE